MLSPIAWFNPSLFRTETYASLLIFLSWCSSESHLSAVLEVYVNTYTFSRLNNIIIAHYPFGYWVKKLQAMPEPLEVFGVWEWEH